MTWSAIYLISNNQKDIKQRHYKDGDNGNYFLLLGITQVQMYQTLVWGPGNMLY